MSTSASLEEKLDAILKSNHEITSSNRELKAQNEYLRKQVGTFLKKQKLNEETSYSPPRGQEQVFSHNLEYSSFWPWHLKHLGMFLACSSITDKLRQIPTTELLMYIY